MSNSITKFFRRGPRAPEKDLKYADFGFVQNHLIESPACRLVDNDDSDDDGASISTLSTTATADNLPGPGRIIDMYIYQFLGRRIERLANRFSMSRLPPARILQCLGGGVPFLYLHSINRFTRLSEVIAQIHDLKYSSHPGGTGVVRAGLQSLVRQTQSDSVYRSAAALTALFHLAISNYKCTSFVLSAAESEHILHVETLAQRLSESNSAKQHLGILTCLVRQWSLLTRPQSMTRTCPEADQLWQRLIDLLDSYRAQFRDGDTQYESAENGLFEILRSGFILFSQSIHFAWATQNRSSSLDEAHYYLTIFLTHCIVVQYQRLAKAGDAAQLQRMVLSTCMLWIQACCPEYMCRIHDDLRSLESKYKLDSLRPVLTQYGYLPSDIHSAYYEGENLPRKYRLQARYRTIVKQYAQVWISRSRRLLFSYEELDREARDTRIAQSSKQPWKRYSGEKLSHSRKHARQHLARHMGASEDDTKSLIVSWAEGEFVDVRDSAGRAYAVTGDVNMEFVQSLVKDGEDDDTYLWSSYKKCCRERHEWGKYLCSNLDWDWDVASCLKRLFKQPKSERRERAQRQAAPQASIVTDETRERKLDVTIDGAHTRLPKTVEVKYKNAAGEFKYMRYFADPFAEGYSRLSGESPLGSIPTVGSVPLPDAECGSAVEENPDDEVAEKTNGTDPEGALQPEPCFTCTKRREKEQISSCVPFEDSVLDVESPIVETEGSTVLHEVAVGDDPMKTTENCAVKVPGITIISQAEVGVSAHATLIDSSHPYSTEYESNGAMAHDQISILSLD